MTILVLYVAMCATLGPNGECARFEPMSWEYSTEQERTQAHKECTILANAYLQLQDVKEVDCFIEQ